MKLVSIDTSLFDKYKNDLEVLAKSNRPYRTEGNPFAILIQTIIDKNTKIIVDECQTYLDAYAKGHHPQFSTDIDYLLSQLFPDNNPHST